MSWMRLGWLALTLLAGCAKVLDFANVPVPAAAGPTTMAAGYGHTCVIRTDHTLWCWGDNDEGQLGLGVDTPELDDAMQIGIDQWKSVSSAAYTTCAIRSDDTLWCWGYNTSGQVGNGSNAEANAPVQQPGTWRAVSAGYYHTCGIQKDGSLWCWGDNEYGGLGDGTQTASTVPVAVSASAVWQTVTAGDYHTCAVTTDGATWCWGYNHDGECGTGDTTSPVVMPTLVATDERYAVVAAGYSQTCGVTTDGHLRCWGDGGWGQLGAAVSQRTMPGAVTIDGRDSDGFLGVASDGVHSCAWKSDGSGYCWGDSSRGELGVDGAYAVTAPNPIQDLGNPWVAAAVGWHHVCWADSKGALACAGSRGWGQLDDGASAQLAPHRVDASTYMRVYGGQRTTCAIANDASGTNNGPGVCGGDNTFGALGNGDRTSKQVPTPVAGSTRWDSFATGEYHTCGVDKNEQLSCWGLNSHGQLGFPAGMGFLVQPSQVTLSPPTEPVTQLAAYEQTCIVNTASELHCWGQNNTGQVGDGTTTDVFADGAAIDSASPWRDVAAGLGFTCAIKSSGDLWCWGQNDLGQLARNTMSNTPSPTPASSGVSGGAKIAAGSYMACMIVTGGAAMCWGYFYDNVHVAPFDIAPGMKWSKLAIGEYHVCGIASDMVSLYCWGINNRGQLGTGAAFGTDASQPQQIPGTWSDVAAGFFHTCAVDTSGALYCWGSDEDGTLLDGHAWTAELVPVDLPPL